MRKFFNTARQRIQVGAAFQLISPEMPCRMILWQIFDYYHIWTTLNEHCS